MNESILVIDVALLVSEDEYEAERKARQIIAQITLAGIAVMGWRLEPNDEGATR